MQEKHPPEEFIRDQTLRRFRSENNSLSSSKKIKVSAEIRIRTVQPVSTSMNFSYEVEQ
jgi:hypothetical protein